MAKSEFAESRKAGAATSKRKRTICLCAARVPRREQEIIRAGANVFTSFFSPFFSFFFLEKEEKIYGKRTEGGIITAENVASPLCTLPAPAYLHMNSLCVLRFLFFMEVSLRASCRCRIKNRSRGARASREAPPLDSLINRDSL